MNEYCRNCGYPFFTANSYGGLIKCVCKDCKAPRFFYKSKVPNWDERYHGSDMEVNADGTIKFHSII